MTESPKKSPDKIRIPVIFILALSYTLALFAPTCFIETQLSERHSCWPCHFLRDATYHELQPPILILVSGFSWKASAENATDSVNYSYHVIPAFLLLIFLIAPLPTLAMMLYETTGVPKGKRWERWKYMDLSRRQWRGILWIVGLCMLLLGAYWAWTYVIFYASMDRNALIDPLLTSIIGTFLLMGFGFGSMMLSVRSKAIWPVHGEEES